jgi:NitT/TauT family transport system substrate-binding protein
MRTLLLAAVAVFSLASAPAQAADPLTLQLKWFADTQFAGYFVAQAKGYYKDAGLDVTIKPGGPDITPSQVLGSGGADVTVDWLSAALPARENGVPVVNIAQVFQRSGMELTCRKDSGVRKPGDLKGKTLGVWFSGNEYPFLAWMAKLGFTTEGANPDVKVVRQGGGVELLTQKQAACISTMSYNEYLQVLEAGLKPSQLVVFRYEDQGVATLEDGLYVLQAKLADPAMQDRLDRFVRASVEGWRYAVTPVHQAEAIRLVMRDNAAKALQWSHQWHMIGEIAKLIGGSPHGIGYLEPAAFERTVAVLSGSANPVLHAKPEGAWTHDIWDKAFAR